MNRPRFFLLTTLAVLLVSLGFFALGNTRPQAIAYGEASGNYLIYLPYVVKSGENNPTATPTSPPGSTSTPTATATLASTPTPTLPPTSNSGAFFVDDQFRSNSADIIVDADGGMHVAYAYYEAANDGAPTYGVYLYCPGDCMNFDHWSGVGMGELVSEIQLDLTPDGSPRILYRAFGAENSNDFYYAACDGDCTNPAMWTVTWVTYNQGTAILELSDDTLPQRYFSLDPNGNPRFVYFDYNFGVEPDHIGTYYVYCDNFCDDTNSWQEVRINQDNGNPNNYKAEDLYYPVLTFSPQGQPRVVTAGSSMNDESLLFYLACDSACGSTSSWTTVPLYDRGSGTEVSYDIAIDGQGRPRIAFYQGAMLGGLGDQLFYVWCDTNCLNSSNWQSKDLGLGVNNGRGPDLELTENGLPRIAYALWNVGGVGYSWCHTNCASTSANWQHQVVESGADLVEAWDVVFPAHCDAGFWDGLTPVLSLDVAGNPYIAFDAAYHARCWYNPDTGEWDPQPYFHLIWRVVRVNYFTQP